MVLRHGPLVLRACRELLGDHHAVEDAFQATFLVLARKARTIRRWLGRPGDRPSPGEVSLGVERLDSPTLRAARVASFLEFVQIWEEHMNAVEEKLRSNPDHVRNLVVYGAPSWPVLELGAYEVLRCHRGRPTTTPDSLRAARIDDCLGMMRGLGQAWGPDSR